MSMSTLHIACAADEGYLPHCAAMLASLLEHNAHNAVAIHFLHGPALPKKDSRAIQRMAEDLGARFECLEVADHKVDGLQQRQGVAGVMWYRVLLPELLPNLDRVLYLDADMLILGDLRPLWDTKLGSSFTAAVENVFEPRFLQRPIALGMRQTSDYFNSGVLLLNLNKMRSEQASKRIFELARSRIAELQWQDQDPFNMVFDGAWTRAHPRWNCQNSLYFFDYAIATFGRELVFEAIKMPAIVHFEGPEFTKPWHRLCRHPLRAEYWRQRARTPWPDVNYSGDSLRNRLVRHFPFRVQIIFLDVYNYSMRILRRHVVPFLRSGRSA